MKDLKPLKTLISFNDAMEILLSHVKNVQDVELLSIDEANGRVLSEEVIAPIDVPHFDRSAMDGYAVKAEDTFGASLHNPVTLELSGSVFPGEIPDAIVEKGKCFKVSTGAMIPEGADSVVILEETETVEKKVFVYKPVFPGANITKKGADIKKGTKILPKGCCLTPSKIGVIASLGLKEIKVFRKPQIALIPTGNEIILPGENLQMGKVYNINSFTLSALIKENGCIPIVFPLCPDEEKELRKRLKEALNYDLIVIIGGSSVGERDIVMDVLMEIGEILFHGIAVKPGKPTLGAVADEKLVIGMPGHPTSCLSNGYMILIPILRKIANLPPKYFQILKGKLSKRISVTLGRMQFLSVKLNGEEVIPVFKESGTITSMAEADGYIEIPGNKELIERGEEVEVKIF
jgi:molybdenum cofactor synthesis domain-containing protein